MSNNGFPLFDNPDNIPDRDPYVLGQGFSRNIAKCRALVPDSRMWPEELDGAAINESRLRIDRRLIFRIAERAQSDEHDDWAAIQLHVAIAAWGAPPGIPMTRAFRPFSQPNARGRLSEAVRVVRTEGAESAYKAMSRNGKLRIPDLGPSYFTKFLYFAGYGAKPLLSEPLIMDDNVITALAQITKESWTACSSDYVRYIDAAADWASQYETSPDVIERRLYEIGEGSA
jgi:hypothetical protein